MISHNNDNCFSSNYFSGILVTVPTLLSFVQLLYFLLFKKRTHFCYHCTRDLYKWWCTIYHPWPIINAKWSGHLSFLIMTSQSFLCSPTNHVYFSCQFYESQTFTKSQRGEWFWKKLSTFSYDVNIWPPLDCPYTCMVRYL